MICAPFCSSFPDFFHCFFKIGRFVPDTGHLYDSDPDFTHIAMFKYPFENAKLADSARLSIYRDLNSGSLGPSVSGNGHGKQWPDAPGDIRYKPSHDRHRPGGDLTQRRIMHMGYFGKQVMFDLKIQSAHQPGNQPVMGGKIGRGHYLVNRPFVFHFTGFDIGHRKSSMLNGMRQLEYDTDHQTGNHGHNKKTNQPGS